jgi:hypothetical protein
LISFGISFFGILGATLIPAYIALYLIPNLRTVPIRYIAATGIGLTLWFWTDTMGDAAYLQVNESVYPLSSFGGIAHAVIMAVFLGGISVLAILDHFAVPKSFSTGTAPQDISKSYSNRLFIIPVAVALVMGIHGLGEGWDFGSVASSPGVTDLVSTFGNIAALISYPIHKLLEAGIIASAYACYVARVNLPIRKNWWQIPLLGILFGGPSVIGATLGYFVSFDTTYFYAFGVTAAIYAVLRLVQALGSDFQIGTNAPIRFGGKIFLALAFGFFLLYGAALLH